MCIHFEFDIILSLILFWSTMGKHYLQVNSKHLPSN